MIYLNAEVISGLGEDTFWTWFKREFKTCSFEIPKLMNDEDVLMRYSTLGFHPISGKQVALCWELYPEMKRVFKLGMWDKKIEKVFETARYSTYRTVATDYSVKDYSAFGSVEVLPIGVDTDLFRPMKNKTALRLKYGIPANKEVGFWIGTLHPMKGFSELIKYARLFPKIFWIVVWKWKMEAGFLPGAKNYIQLKQEQLVEVINCADFFLLTSVLKPYYMAEWEVFSCNLKTVNIGCEREFTISEEPRNDVFLRGWDRKNVKRQWELFFEKRGVNWYQ